MTRFLYHAEVTLELDRRVLGFRLVVDGSDGSLVACFPGSSADLRQRFAESVPCPERSELFRKAVEELRSYAAGHRTRFDLLLRPEGSAFRQRVWSDLLGIPFGGTRTYGRIASSLGLPGAARAVGQACRANPLLLVQPCHRVIGAGGLPLGYAGGVELLDALRRLEGWDPCNSDLVSRSISADTASFAARVP